MNRLICGGDLAAETTWPTSSEGGTGQLRLAAGEVVHSFQIPGDAGQSPLPVCRLRSSERELRKAHHRFDDPKDGLGDSFALPVDGSTRRGLQPVSHLLHRIGVFPGWLRFFPAFVRRQVVGFPLDRNIGKDRMLATKLHVGTTVK